MSKQPTVGVVVFPGSNCDHDVEHVCGSVLGYNVKPLWHRDSELTGCDVVVVPGGFSYGDYLRTGALANLSPIMGAIKEFVARGGRVLGICNGFQILCESQLLPGALMQNISTQFLSRYVYMRVDNAQTPFTKAYTKGAIIQCPIAHGEGNFYAPEAELKELEQNNQVVVRYCNENGEVAPEDRESNPNGSLNAIAGICNRERNVVGLMPHPERAAEVLVGWIGGASGRGMFEGW